MPWKHGDEQRRVAQLPEPLDDKGVLTCPDCGCQHFDVSHTHKWSGGEKRRRRVCSHCGWSVTTAETVIPDR